MNKKHYKFGFSLTELLVSVTIMAVLSVLVTYAITQKTKKTLSNPTEGRIICYKDIDGTLRKETYIKRKDGTSKSTETPKECVFDIPVNAKNTIVYVIGGGGGGEAELETNKLEYQSSSEKKLELNYYNSGVSYNNYGEDYFTSNMHAREILCTKTSGSNQITTPLKVPENQDGSVTQVSCGGDNKDIKYFFNVSSTITIHSYKYKEKFLCNGESTSVVYRNGIDESMAKSSNIKDYFNEEGQTLIKDIAKKEVFKNDYIGPITKFKNFSQENGNFKLEVPEVNCVCYNKQFVCLDDKTVNGNDYFYNVRDKSAIYATVEKINSIKVPYGKPGANGQVIKLDAASQYAGKTIKIKANDIGNGGAVGENGKPTYFKDEFGIYNATAQGGVSYKGSYKQFGCAIGNNDKLGADYKLKNKMIALLNNSESINNGRTPSSYYDDPDNIMGIKNIDDIVLPNSVCEVNGNDYTIPTSKVNEEQYRNNYGGGGGGYVPCVQYGCIKKAAIHFYDKNTNVMKTNSYKHEDSYENIPKYFHGESTRGMGGAVIIKWQGI